MPTAQRLYGEKEHHVQKNTERHHKVLDDGTLRRNAVSGLGEYHRARQALCNCPGEQCADTYLLASRKKVQRACSTEQQGYLWKGDRRITLQTIGKCVW